AVAKGRTDVLAFGDIGLTRSQSVPPFSEFDIALPSFDPAAVGATWDVAFYDLPSSVAWARTYQDFSGPSAHIAPFLPSLLDGGFKPALFTTFAMSDMLSDPIAFGAWESTIAVRRSGLTETFPATGADSWTLWAEERAGVKGTVQLVAIGGSTEAAWVGSCADASGGADPNCSFAVDPLHQLDTSTPPRKVTAIWGIQRGADIDVYAVGNDVAPWLGVARLPTDPLQTLDWAYAPLPAPMQQAGGIVSSVWVGLDENENETLIVVGSSGVFAADPNALSFTPP
ncbi:MAG: hypothetical protein JNK04_02070, partial [Myxococcales bacterium]|nr:hypothetical protein [Myxococcales bacterium]